MSDKIPVAADTDVDEAVDAANAAFAEGSTWRRMTNIERQKILLTFADLLVEHQEHLAYLSRLTLGAPYNPFGKSEIGTAIGCFRCKSLLCSALPALVVFLVLTFDVDYAGWVDKYAGQSFPADDGFYKIVRNEPLGVVAG